MIETDKGVERMNATIQSCTLVGIDVQPVVVEVDLLSRLPRFTIVGLREDQHRETATRVRSAIVASGFEFPRQRIVVNLAPADLRKEGTGLDLPIAIGILAATGQYTPPENVVFLGELGLDGSIRSVRAEYAALVTHGRNLRASEYATLRDLVAGGTKGLRSSFFSEPVAVAANALGDFSAIRGTRAAIPSLIEAARTGRPLVLLGPSGSRKTSIAERFIGLLPDPTNTEAVELLKISAAAGLNTAVYHRRFRAPHPTVAASGMYGDRSLRPGEVSLAHGGVLLLDEVSAFPSAVLASVRRAWSGKKVSLPGLSSPVEIPSDFHLIVTAWSADHLEHASRWLGPVLKDAIVVPLDRVDPHDSEPWPSTSELRALVAREENVDAPR